MTWKLQCNLPLPPSANAQYTVANGRLVSTANKRAFNKTVTTLLLGASLPPPNAFFRMRLVSTLQNGMFLRRDIDNFIKAAQDAVCKALGVNDARVVEVQARKIIGNCPGLLVEMEEICAEEPALSLKRGDG